MARISILEAQAWLESTKATLASLDADLLAQIESLVLSLLSTQFDVSGWTDTTTTPQIVRTCIAMKYCAWVYRRQYSEEGDTNEYADLLDRMADTTIQGLINGTVIVVEEPDSTAGQPVFYPTDASTAMEPTSDDMSLGPEAFSMGRTF